MSGKDGIAFRLLVKLEDTGGGNLIFDKSSAWVRNRENQSEHVFLQKVLGSDGTMQSNREDFAQRVESALEQLFHG